MNETVGLLRQSGARSRFVTGGPPLLLKFLDRIEYHSHRPIGIKVNQTGKLGATCEVIEMVWDIPYNAVLSRRSGETNGLHRHRYRRGGQLHSDAMSRTRQHREIYPA